MGLLHGHAEYVAKVCAARNISGSVLTLGRIDVFSTIQQYRELFCGLGLAHIKDGLIHFFDPQIESRVQHLFSTRGHRSQSKHNPQISEEPAISDSLFFSSLGFTTIDSVEISDYEGANVIFDMNDEDITTAISRRYNLVLDCGMMEHIFDPPRVMRHIVRALDVGGNALHIMPGNNFYDHGFYQISPMLFRDFYTENRFEDIDVLVMEYAFDTYAHPQSPVVKKLDRPRLWDYNYDIMRVNSFGQLGHKLYYTIACARKGEQSTWDRIPYQGGF